GRYITGVGEERFVGQSMVTAGAVNNGPRVGPVLISEIMYHPPAIYANGAYWNSLEHEYIELFNAGASTVNLGDFWKLTGDVSFEFPAGTSLAPGGYLLVVNFDPAMAPGRLQEFRTYYGL